MRVVEVPGGPLNRLFKSMRLLSLIREQQDNQCNTERWQKDARRNPIELGGRHTMLVAVAL